MKAVKHKDVFIRIGSSVSVSDAVAYLESLGYENHWSDGFTPPSSTEAIFGDSGGWLGWCKSADWGKENGFQEIFIPTTKHKHYDLIVKWLSDPLQGTWVKIDGKLVEIDVITLVRDAIGHHVEIRVQHESPKHKIMIGDTEIDAPEIESPRVGTEYFIPNVGRCCPADMIDWRDSALDHNMLKRGLVHLNKEAAITHAKALIKVGGGCVDE